MEDVLELYHAPYDPQVPLVCMDESNKQLVGEVHPPLPPAPGRGQIVDHEYVRNGVAEIFLEVEPLSGRRHVAITQTRTRKDWALFIQDMLEQRYPQATKVRLVMDNLTASPRSTRLLNRSKLCDWPDAWKFTTLPNMAVGSMWPKLSSASYPASALTAESRISK